MYGDNKNGDNKNGGNNQGARGVSRHGLFAGKLFAGNSNGNFKIAGNLPAKTANFSLCDMYHNKLLKSY